MRLPYASLVSRNKVERVIRRAAEAKRERDLPPSSPPPTFFPDKVVIALGEWAQCEFYVPFIGKSQSRFCRYIRAAAAVQRGDSTLSVYPTPRLLLSRPTATIYLAPQRLQRERVFKKCKLLVKTFEFTCDTCE